MLKMVLELSVIINPLGIYGSKKDILPTRMCYLHPEAAGSFNAMMEGGAKIRVSDMFRSAEASLLARSQKTGVQPPGFSAHNYGLAVDIDVDENIKRLKLGTKKALDELMKTFGWYCHRRDGGRGKEDWHFNYLGFVEAKKLLSFASNTSTSGAIERKIQNLYGSLMKLTPKQVQQSLLDLGLYKGAIDGKLGPLSETALKVFQKGWSLPQTGQADEKTQRLLSYLTSDISLLEPQTSVEIQKIQF